MRHRHTHQSILCLSLSPLTLPQSFRCLLLFVLSLVVCSCALRYQLFPLYLLPSPTHCLSLCLTLFLSVSLLSLYRDLNITIKANNLSTINSIKGNPGYHTVAVEEEITLRIHSFTFRRIVCQKELLWSYCHFLPELKLPRTSQKKVVTTSECSWQNLGPPF